MDAEMIRQVEELRRRLAKLETLEYPTIPAQVFPTHATLWHDESIAVVGNAILLDFNTSQKYSSLSYQSAAANNDEFTQTFFIGAGTYTFKCLGRTALSHGKIDWSIDSGATIITTGQDWYSASTTYNVVKSVANVVITTSGLHTLKGKINGKNASSSDYLMMLTKMWFYQ